ncbi:hypothetical protein GCM10009738_12510 [Kitasatospora viridis]
MAGGDQHIHYGPGVRRVGIGEGAEALCPYPGMTPFGPEQSHWFFGRDQAVATVCAQMDKRLGEGGALVVIGPSGVGKSSLLAAGVLPRVAAGAMPTKKSSHLGLRASLPLEPGWD